MSLCIDLDEVTDVLLVDGWHKVAKKSFSLDAYEYVWKGETVLWGGMTTGVPSMGYSFEEEYHTGELCGPLTAILGVRHKRSPRR